MQEDVHAPRDLAQPTFLETVTGGQGGLCGSEPLSRLGSVRHCRVGWIEGILNQLFIEREVLTMIPCSFMRGSSWGSAMNTASSSVSMWGVCPLPEQGPKSQGCSLLFLCHILSLPESQIQLPGCYSCTGDAQSFRLLQ